MTNVDERPLEQRGKLFAGALSAAIGAAGFSAIVLALHALRSDYDPTNQLISELANGPNGWAMLPAFSLLGASTWGLALSVGLVGRRRLLQLLLVVSGAGFVCAGVFTVGMFPLAHVLSIAVAFVLMVLAMYEFPRAVGWTRDVVPRCISWSLAGGLCGGIALGQTLLSLAVGQRIAALCLVAWLEFASFRLLCLALRDSAGRRTSAFT